MAAAAAALAAAGGGGGGGGGGTNKDWCPQNKLPELILEFAWCSFNHRFEKELWCRLLAPFFN